MHGKTALKFRERFYTTVNFVFSDILQLHTATKYRVTESVQVDA